MSILISNFCSDIDSSFCKFFGTPELVEDFKNLNIEYFQILNEFVKVIYLKEINYLLTVNGFYETYTDAINNTHFNNNHGFNDFQDLIKRIEKKLGQTGKDRLIGMNSKNSRLSMLKNMESVKFMTRGSGSNSLILKAQKFVDFNETKIVYPVVVKIYPLDMNVLIEHYKRDLPKLKLTSVYYNFIYKYLSNKHTIDMLTVIHKALFYREAWFNCLITSKIVQKNISDTFICTRQCYTNNGLPIDNINQFNFLKKPIHPDKRKNFIDVEYNDEHVENLITKSPFGYIEMEVLDGELDDFIKNNKITSEHIFELLYSKLCVAHVLGIFLEDDHFSNIGYKKVNFIREYIIKSNEIEYRFYCYDNYLIKFMDLERYGFIKKDNDSYISNGNYLINYLEMEINYNKIFNINEFNNMKKIIYNRNIKLKKKFCEIMRRHLPEKNKTPPQNDKVFTHEEFIKFKKVKSKKINFETKIEDLKNKFQEEISLYLLKKFDNEKIEGTDKRELKDKIIPVINYFILGLTKNKNNFNVFADNINKINESLLEIKEEIKEEDLTKASPDNIQYFMKVKMRKYFTKNQSMTTDKAMLTEKLLVQVINTDNIQKTIKDLGEEFTKLDEFKKSEDGKIIDKIMKGRMIKTYRLDLDKSKEPLSFA